MRQISNNKSPSASDIIIGRNVRLQRLERAMSLSALARSLGVADPEPLRLVQAFARVHDAAARKVIVELVEVMARRGKGAT